jgi:signal transduction histidine kinase
MNEKYRYTIIAALIALITLAHYQMGQQYLFLHDLSRRLYYLPIILSALWFGRKGGILAAVLVSAFFLPHGMFMWYGENMRYVDNLIEIILFNILGFIIGDYIERKNRQRLQAEEAARQLREAYDKLQSSTGKIIRLEEELRFSDRLAILGELSASMAHEVRNPLAGIQGAAEILRSRFPDTDAAQEFVQIQLREIQRLNQVVENYLSLARSEKPQMICLDLLEMIRSTLALLNVSMRHKQITIETEFHELLLAEVTGDAVQLRQLLLNISLNAMQAVQSGGLIRFEVVRQADPDSYLISVKDNGIGIDPAQAERIFEPFHTTRGDGTGLGLAIARRIVSLHRGRIWFESSSGSTTFFIELPVITRAEVHPENAL